MEEADRNVQDYVHVSGRQHTQRERERPAAQTTDSTLERTTKQTRAEEGGLGADQQAGTHRQTHRPARRQPQIEQRHAAHGHTQPNLRTQVLWVKPVHNAKAENERRGGVAVVFVSLFFGEAVVVRLVNDRFEL